MLDNNILFTQNKQNGGGLLLLSKISFYGVTLILLLLIVFLTFKFNKKTENKIVSQNDNEYIASYIEGEYQNEIPGKDDGYIVDKIVCDNGATATWDYDDLGIDIRNATQKIKCGVYFIVKPVSVIEKVTTLATTDTTNFATDDPDNNIRYIGADPNNYVYFNCSDYTNQSDSTCEKWRIIGLFKNVTKSDGTKGDLVKIVRNENIGEIPWDNNKVNYWITSSLQIMLNGEYYNGTSNLCCLKNDTTRNAIENVEWNLGGTADYTTSSNGLASHWYGYERGTKVYSGRPTTWTGKIALMYPSDYGYATAGGTTTNRDSCLAKELYNWDGSDVSDCKNNDYIFKSDYTQWTLTSNSYYSIYSFGIASSGIVEGYSVNNTPNSNKVHPALYLKSSVSIATGEGTSESPYQLKLN